MSLLRKKGTGGATPPGSWLKQNKHFWLIIYVPIYLTVFFLLEKHITADYFVSYLPLDDKIPFCEYFIVFYCLWYPFLILTGIHLLMRDADGFRRYMLFIILGFSASMLICALFPNGQDLRPQVFPRNNCFAWLVRQIYAADTNTNVLPSMHVVGCIAACSSIVLSKSVKRSWIKWGSIVLSALISASTLFVKQHSALDMIAAVFLCIPIYLIVFPPKRKRGRKAPAAAGSLGTAPGKSNRGFRR